MCLTIFRPRGFACWQALLREGRLGVHLPTHLCFVSQVVLHEQWVLLDVLKQYGERCVLVETLDE